MTTIANKKFSEMVQLEFQNSGSAAVSAMLLQPLLEKASTFVCEVTDLQCTINQELVFPEDKWLFSIVRKPVFEGNAQVNPANFTSIYVNIPKLTQYQQESDANNAKSFDEYEVWGHYDAFGIPFGQQQPPSQHWFPRTIFYYEPATPVNNEYFLFEETELGEPNANTLNPQLKYSKDNAAYETEEFVMKSRKYYSALDFVHDVTIQLAIWEKTVMGDHLQIPDMWYNRRNLDSDLIRFVVDGSGHVMFICQPEFLENYMLLTSKLFQSVTGLPELIYLSQDAYSNSVEINTVQGLLNLDNPILDPDFPAYWHDEVRATVRNVWQGVAPVNPKIYKNQNHSIFDGFDIRKQLSLEVSLPIPHTLAWDGTKESTRFVLQEFVIPSGAIDSKYIMIDHAIGVTQLRETQQIGPAIFLNGGSNMALKKLFEGQLQAFRIDLVLHYDDWNSATHKYVRKKKVIDMNEADFFYLKLLFTKETL